MLLTGSIGIRLFIISGFPPWAAPFLGAPVLRVSSSHERNSFRALPAPHLGMARRGGPPRARGSTSAARSRGGGIHRHVPHPPGGRPPQRLLCSRLG